MLSIAESEEGKFNYSISSHKREWALTNDSVCVVIEVAQELLQEPEAADATF